MYSLTVKDQNGCPGTASKTVNVVDISDGKKGDKILVCHNAQSITIATPAVATHLQHGDMLGGCESNHNAITVRTTDNLQAADLTVRVLANPSPTYFDIQMRSAADKNVRITVYDNVGRVIEMKSLVPANQTVRLGNFYRPGTYLVEIIQGTQKQILRLIKTH